MKYWISADFYYCGQEAFLKLGIRLWVKMCVCVCVRARVCVRMHVCVCSAEKSLEIYLTIP